MFSCFYVTITGDFERFHYFNFKTSFLENWQLFKKLEYNFLGESTTIENAAFLCKTALSKTKVKTDGMGSTKWTSHKKGVLQLNTFFFENLISV